MFVKFSLSKWVTFFIICASIFSLIIIEAKAAETYEVELVIENHKFIPETLVVPSGCKIIITVHNKDSTAEEFESTDLKREKFIAGKSKARIILAPLKPGKYHFFGEFHAETAKGEIDVREEV